ncbi:MAG: hypothetical protein ACREKS_00295, partial [Candidatus Rokuibacteriota bacterium]
MNTPRRHAVCPAATLAVATAFLLVGCVPAWRADDPEHRRATQDASLRQEQQASAQSSNPVPLRGGTQQIPEATVAQEERPRLFRAPSGQLFRVGNRVDENGGSAIVLASSADGRAWQPWPDLRPDVSGVRAHDGRVAVNAAGDIALAYRWTRPRSAVKHVRLARSSELSHAWTLPPDNLD